MTQVVIENQIPQITLIDRIIARTFLKLLPSWVTPNQITTFRFLTIPGVVYLLYAEHYLWGLIFFAISAFTDALDGALARTKNQITDWGKTYDPLADKLLVGSMVVLLVVQQLGYWLGIVIVLIELFLIINAAYNLHFNHKVIQAVFVGKLKMFLQCVGIILILLSIITGWIALLEFARWALYVAIFLGTISLVVYRSI